MVKQRSTAKTACSRQRTKRNALSVDVDDTVTSSSLAHRRPQWWDVDRVSEEACRHALASKPAGVLRLFSDGHGCPS